MGGKFGPPVRFRDEGIVDSNVLRARGYQYLLTSTARISRYVRSPVDFPRQAHRVRRHRRRVRRTCELLAGFSRPPGPGAELFGSTVDFIHNPHLQVWRVPSDDASVFTESFESGDTSQWSKAVN